jgi:hypothetical protein
MNDRAPMSDQRGNRRANNGDGDLNDENNIDGEGFSYEQLMGSDFKSQLSQLSGNDEVEQQLLDKGGY